MPWFRIDDGFYDHPKVLSAGNSAAGLLVRLGSYAAKHGTDGRIPGSVVKTFGTRTEIRQLLSVGMLEVAGADYIIHDYLDRNPSADQIRAERDAVAERQRRWRESRGRNAVTDAVTNGDGCNTVINGAPTQPNPYKNVLHTQDRSLAARAEPVDISDSIRKAIQ
jgi:hypothetical protein